MMKSRGLFIIILLTLITSACANPKYLEKMGLQIAISYDRIEDHRILGTSVYHLFSPEAGKPIQVLSATALTSKGVRQAMNLESNKKLVSGQIRVALYGEETAKRGMISLVDSISRDPDIGTMLYLIVTKGRAHDVLSYEYKNIKNIGTFLYELNQQNIMGEQIVSNTEQEFLHDYYSEGKDPILPYLEQIGEEIKFTGSAVFRNDVMVGKLPVKENFCIKLLRDRFDLGTFEISAPTDNLKDYLKRKAESDFIYFSLDNIRSDTKIKLVNKETPEFDVNIEMTARVLEASQEIDLGMTESVKAVEKETNRCIKNSVTKTVKKLQKFGADPIGFGKVYRTSVRNDKLTNDDLLKLFQKAKINIKTKTTIMRTGVLE